VQLEYNDSGQWKPVVRFDNSHGFVHRDRYFADGTKEKHYFIAEGDLRIALDSASKDLDEHWENWLREYHEGLA
jgi:hypothetical protein